MLGADDELERTLSTETKEPDKPNIELGDGDEEILWEGRPFLSVTERYLITSERIPQLLAGKVREQPKTS